MRIQSPTISLTTTKDGQTGASAFVHIKYSDDGQTFTGHEGEDIGKFMGIYTDDVEQDSTTFADYTWNKIVGDDAYTVVLTNENFSFAVDSNRKPLSNQSVQTGFIVFRGTQQVTNFTIGTVTPPTGISYSELNGVITFSVSTTTSLTADSGSILIPINITNSLTIQKYATWSLSYKGNTGDTGGKGDKGDTGATVSTQKDQYYLSTSNIELLGDTWHDGDPPSIPTGKYLWIRVENTMTDGTIVHSNAVYKSTIQGLVSDVDNVKGSITNKVWESDITSELTAYDGGTSSVTNTVRDRVSQTEQDITGITSRVGAVESTTTGLSTRMTTAESNIIQNANKIAAAVTVTEDGQTHETSITLTPEMLEAVTDQFVVKSPDGNSTVISGGQMSTDAIKSNNYVEPTSSTTPFSASGSFFDLSNGDIVTPSFTVDHDGVAKLGDNNSYISFDKTTGQLSAKVSSISIGNNAVATQNDVATANSNANAAQASADAAQSTANGRMKADMSNRASSISIDSGKIAFNSNSLVVNSSKFTLDQNGNATFSGTLSAAGGTFAGKVVATISYIDKYGQYVTDDVSIVDPDKGYPIVVNRNYYSNLVENAKLSSRDLIITQANSQSNDYTRSSMEFSRFSCETKFSSYLNITTISPTTVMCAHKNREGTTTYQYYQISYDGPSGTSDRRLKENIEDVSPEIAKAIKPHKFRFKETDRTRYGFIAQEVQEIMPDAVKEDTDGYLLLSYQDMIAPLYALVQEQQTRIDELENRIERLEALIEKIAPKEV